MLLIHADHTPRLSYVLNVFFGDRGLIPVGYRLTQDVDEFRTFEGPRMSYGEQPVVEDALFIRSAGLLHQEGISPQNPAPFPWEDTLALFPTEVGVVPFDMFSAAFYLISRYEEYGTVERDVHGRFLPASSLQYQHGFLRKPVVNQYAVYLRQFLKKHGLPELPFTGISTIDVDVAYAYRGRSLFETVGGLVKSLIPRQGGRFNERATVLLGRKPDPYDTYGWISEVHEAAGLSPVYFFLMRRGTGLDRALDPKSKIMRELILQHADRYQTGLHPSYGSLHRTELIREEKDVLEQILQAPVIRSRQHYLRFELPVTFRTLLELGIQEEYSMAYAAEPGFRAGIAHPFPYYDLPHEEETALTLYPTACMDGTLKEYKKLQTNEAEEVIREMVESVRSTGGTFVSVWHNSSLTERDGWQGWRNIYKFLLGMIAAQKQYAT